MQVPFPDPVLRSEAFDVLSALDAYELAAARLLATWPDADVYAEFRRQIDAIREHGVSSAALTVLSLQLMIAHSELVSTLWQNACVGLGASKIEEVRLRHAVAVEALRIAAASLARSA